MTKVVLESGVEIEIEDTPLGRGATGVVYPAKDGKHVVKMFHAPSASLADVMRSILGKYDCTRDTDARRHEYWTTLYVWPLALVTQPALGLLLPRYPAHVRGLVHLFGPRANAALPRAAREWNLRVILAWKLAQAVARMHRAGLAHSDLSPTNVLADPITTDLRLIDLDGLVVPDFVPPTVLGTPGYMAPEVLSGHGPPGTATDRHALAILIYQLLLGRHPLMGPYNFDLDPFETEAIEAMQMSDKGLYIEHPSDSRNRPSKLYSASMLGASLVGLFEASFVRGLVSPSSRPGADEWRTALGRLIDRLVECSNPHCVDRYFPVVHDRPVHCPWCGEALRFEGGLPALRLYDPGPVSPSLVDDFWIVGHPGKTLHAWHRDRGAEPDQLADQAPVARLEHIGSTWQLVNVSIPGMREIVDRGSDGRIVEVGDAVVLHEGTILRLGPPLTARFLLVQWIK